MLAAVAMIAAGLAVAPPAQAAPQEVRVTSAFVLTDTIDFERGAHRLTLFLLEPIPLGVHGTVTASACGQVLGTMPFIGRRPDGRTGDAVDVMVNGVLVT